MIHVGLWRKASTDVLEEILQPGRLLKLEHCIITHCHSKHYKELQATVNCPEFVQVLECFFKLGDGFLCTVKCMY